MTILLPVLLDKVPSFYVPGKFDTDLDRYSETADRISQVKLDYKLERSTVPPAAECNPRKIAKSWLSQLDSAVSQNDSKLIISMFAPDGVVRATVRDGDGKMTSIDLKREEFMQSTVQSMKELKDYKQHRVTLEAKFENGSTASSCNRISLQSGIVEEGYQSGKPFRFESVEKYLLELQDGKWLSIKAETIQK
jgi:hypothetical protein